MKKYIFICILSIMGFTSCKTVRKVTSATENIKTEIIQYPTTADLDIQEKVEKTVTWNFSILNYLHPSLETRKKNLIADIVKENNADILIDAQSSFTLIPFGKRTLTITGYPGTFKNFRKASIKDIEAYKIVNKDK